MPEDFAKEFIEQAVYRINESTKRIIICLNDLEEEDVWKRPNSISNSVGNIILHLCGNITQYIISSLGKEDDNRERDKEFAASGGHTRLQLIEHLTDTLDKALAVIKNMNEESLLQKRSVQGYNISGIGIIMHVTEHYSYHAGQVAFWTKSLKNKDLGFYAGIDLNKKNKL